MTRITKLLTAAIVAVPTFAAAQSVDEQEAITLEMLMEDYPDVSATDFEVLDVNGDGVLTGVELEELEEYDLDEDGIEEGDSADTE
ncbi:hypothetical protein [Histidinibacterium aquaticum]|uniref:EF-hand domain-containing protein n=1 Tax=Histidinibacterium aquaticum TaxID=2613962 RepID=A0A5J5GC56_9RHOB|nr:hypothetical protein [Histidinibacterium aquaticum]KAA9005587.1 hypothetical protein F3S47_16925 [Histidinibacterium aquaticum]